MSNEINDGGPAFPVSDMQGAAPTSDAEIKAFARAMSLRDYFAGLAMQAYRTQREEFSTNPKQVAEWAYADADAMLAARSAKP